MAGQPKSVATSGQPAFTQAEIPALYDKAHEHMRESTVELLKTWQQSFFTHSEEHEASAHQYLEVGCGTGNITRNHVLPLCPPRLKRLVGADISEAMLEYARTAHDHPKVDYRRLDITADEDVSRFIAEEGRFQRVYSFLALHCIQDKAAALKNIERLMTPGGECLVIYHPYAQSEKYYRALLESGLWEEHHGVLWRAMPVFHEINDPVFLRKSFSDLVKLTGIVPLSCELLQVNVKSVNLDDISRMYAMGNAAHRQLTEEEKPKMFEFARNYVQRNQCQFFSTTGSTPQLRISILCEGARLTGSLPCSGPGAAAVARLSEQRQAEAASAWDLDGQERVTACRGQDERWGAFLDTMDGSRDEDDPSPPAKRRRTDEGDVSQQADKVTQKPPDIDENFYSRQLYVLGRDAMGRMAQSDVLISGMGGLGVEIAKNVILAGVRSVTIHDEQTCSVWDLSSQYFLSEANVDENRASACESSLGQLNKYVQVKAHTEPLTMDFLKNFSVVILTETPLKTQQSIGTFTHENNIPL
ncbi:hypothetical protein MTO96_018480 [Rhipicephalus appendiculatus]